MAVHERLAVIIIVMALTTLLPQPGAAESPARISEAAIESLLAPIALYPDTLLTQILIAATYPLDVVEAARFIAAHPELEGSEAVLAAAEFAWDPSVQALTAFPDVLARMDEDLRWTRALGEAFLQQQDAVMVSLQTLRQRARLAGTLRDSEHLRIEQRGERLALEAPRQELVYVPWYDTTFAYGEWPSKRQQPVYWAPSARYHHGHHSVGVSQPSLFWGRAVHLDPLYYPTRLDWHRRGVIIVDRSHGQPWQHDLRRHRAGHSITLHRQLHTDGYAEHRNRRSRADHGDLSWHWERNRDLQRPDPRSWPQEPTASLSQRRVQAIDTRTARERLRALQAEAAATEERSDRQDSRMPPRRFEGPAQTANAHQSEARRQADRNAGTTMPRQQRVLQTRPEPSPSSRRPQGPRTAGTGAGRSTERTRSSSESAPDAGRTTTIRRFGGANPQLQREMRPAAAPTRSAVPPDVEIRQFGRPGMPPRQPD